jgi:hypothetical protein
LSNHQTACHHTAFSTQHHFPCTAPAPEHLALRPGYQHSTGCCHCTHTPPWHLNPPLQALPNGNYRIGVHIADVAHFVQPGTALDKEASERGTSVYLVQRVVPMLPRLLCEELCSLNPGVER